MDVFLFITVKFTFLSFLAASFLCFIPEKRPQMMMSQFVFALFFNDTVLDTRLI